MTKHMKAIIPLSLAAVAIPAFATSGPMVQVVLASPISSVALPGELVTLAGVAEGGKCRYLGELVRVAPPKQTVAFTISASSGSDFGHWHVSVKRSECQGHVQPVGYRVDLPTAPSLAGGGGIPPLPAGYQVGTKFQMRPD